jgi:Type VI secretion system/phage-baseplate injector OB domain
MLDDSSYDELGGKARLYGKFQGSVFNNIDPDNLGRLQAFVPSVLGDVPTGWAKPCVPYAGPTSGFYSVPPVGAGVWIEFEGGDVSLPIWAGCFWGTAELPMKPPGAPSKATTRIWRTETGLTIVMDDAAQTIMLTDAGSLNVVEVSVATGTVTIKGAAQVVSSAPLVKHGSQAAFHPHVFGDQLLIYLAQLVTLFNTHLHVGEMALGILPVTPAPPIVPMPPPSPSLLSNKVLLE